MQRIADRHVEQGWPKAYLQGFHVHSAQETAKHHALAMRPTNLPLPRQSHDKSGVQNAVRTNVPQPSARLRGRRSRQKTVQGLW